MSDTASARNTISLFFFLCFKKLLYLIFFCQFRKFKILSDCVNKQNSIAIVVCIRCTAKQKKYCLFLLSRRCEKCICTNKKCESTVYTVNFFSIDRAIEKLKKKKLKTEIVQTVSTKQLCVVAEQLRVLQTKLECLQKQKKFFRNRKQIIFDKNFFDIEELDCLKSLEKIAIIEKVIVSTLFLNT